MSALFLLSFTTVSNAQVYSNYPSFSLPAGGSKYLYGSPDIFAYAIDTINSLTLSAPILIMYINALY